MRTTSTWGPSAKDCRHPKLDVADVHFYLRPADKGRIDDEVQAVIERTRWLREQAPNKPAHLGEFGLADDKWRITDEMKRSPQLVDAHSALWASALSGASGTALFGWGVSLAHTLSSLYIGYGASVPGAIIGGAWGFLDGYIAGFVIAWLYNRLPK